MIRLPFRCLLRFDNAVADMAAEDAKPMRRRDSRVYAAGYAVIETFGLLLSAPDPSDPTSVRPLLEASIDPALD